MDFGAGFAPAPLYGTPRVQVPPHARGLPLRVGTRGSPLALTQTRGFLAQTFKADFAAALPVIGQPE
jgi:hypothetical protein